MQEVALGESITYTYDVAWKESATHWASRWDIYLTMNHAVKNRVRFLSFGVSSACHLQCFMTKYKYVFCVPAVVFFHVCAAE